VIGRRPGPEEEAETKPGSIGSPEQAVGMSKAKGVAMNVPEKEPTQTSTGSGGRRDTVAVIAAWACIGVAAIAAALLFLF
jgi:hypothetical protein